MGGGLVFFSPTFPLLMLTSQTMDNRCETLGKWLHHIRFWSHVSSTNILDIWRTSYHWFTTKRININNHKTFMHCYRFCEVCEKCPITDSWPSVFIQRSYTDRCMYTYILQQVKCPVLWLQKTTHNIMLSDLCIYPRSRRKAGSLFNWAKIQDKALMFFGLAGYIS